MSYFEILALFILPPLIGLLLWVPRDLWRRLLGREAEINWEPYLIILAHIALALLYTTPWDNYLVATHVWWYDPQLVTGLTIGWVPVEEYIFFILQTAVTGLWTLGVLRYLIRSQPQLKESSRARLWTSLGIVGLWAIVTYGLLLGWKPGTYLFLILSWGLLPVLLQAAFGADILLANWRSITLAVFVPTIYLWFVDGVALSHGTWTIDPTQTTGLMAGIIPIEELIFFFMTNLIIGFGVVLMLSPASKERARNWIKALRSKQGNLTQSNN